MSSINGRLRKFHFVVVHAQWLQRSVQKSYFAYSNLWVFCVSVAVALAFAKNSPFFQDCKTRIFLFIRIGTSFVWHIIHSFIHLLLKIAYNFWTINTPYLEKLRKTSWIRHKWTFWNLSQALYFQLVSLTSCHLRDSMWKTGPLN